MPELSERENDDLAKHLRPEPETAEQPEMPVPPRPPSESISPEIAAVQPGPVVAPQEIPRQPAPGPAAPDLTKISASAPDTEKLAYLNAILKSGSPEDFQSAQTFLRHEKTQQNPNIESETK